MSAGLVGENKPVSITRLSFLQPPARLFAIICLNMVVRAGALIFSPCRIATVRAVLLSCPLGDDAVWVWHDPAVVQEDIDPVLSRQQRTDVSFERKVRLARALDGLHQLRIRGVSQVADLTADGLLPLGQAFDVDVHPWVCVVSRHWPMGGASMPRHPVGQFQSDCLSSSTTSGQIGIPVLMPHSQVPSACFSKASTNLPLSETTLPSASFMEYSNSPMARARSFP